MDIVCNTSRLIIVSHRLSEAQELYQEARELRASTASSGQYFYKDATPRAEHYICCTVELVGYPHRRCVPLRLSLCFDDGTLVPYEDQACLRLLKENVHVRPSISADTMKASFVYRVEIGSFRRADRSFVIRIDAEPTTIGAWPEPHTPRIESCQTPPVYVLSKKRLNGVVTAPSSPTSESHLVSEKAGKKRKHDNDDEYDIQSQLLEKMITLERRVAELTTVVLSTVAAANIKALQPEVSTDLTTLDHPDLHNHPDLHINTTCAH